MLQIWHEREFVTLFPLVFMLVKNVVYLLRNVNSIDYELYSLIYRYQVTRERGWGIGLRILFWYYFVTDLGSL